MINDDNGEVSYKSERYVVAIKKFSCFASQMPIKEKTCREMMRFLVISDVTNVCVPKEWHRRFFRFRV